MSCFLADTDGTKEFPFAKNKIAPSGMSTDVKFTTKPLSLIYFNLSKRR